MTTVRRKEPDVLPKCTKEGMIWPLPYPNLAKMISQSHEVSDLISEDVTRVDSASEW